MIELAQALELMEKKDQDGNPVKFSVQFVTANKSKNTGGQLITLNNVVLSKNRKNKSTNSATVGVSKNSNQWDNATRNFILENGEIRKCHIRLITRFNNTRVIY